MGERGESWLAMALVLLVGLVCLVVGGILGSAVVAMLLP